jgi:hypothetical protein
MNLFAYTKPARGITSDANFTSFLKSFFILYRSSTGENWNDVQADLTRSIQPNNVCYDISDYDDY